MKTNTIKLTLGVAVLGLLFACAKENKKIDPVVARAEIKTESNLYAPTTGGSTTGAPAAPAGAFILFNFEKGATVTDGTWDLAFRATTILVNGGAKVGITDEPERTGTAALCLVTGVFDNLKSAAELTFTQDAKDKAALTASSGAGWYNYAAGLISPIPGRVLVVKTQSGKYVKIEILSYYKDAPATPTDEQKQNAARYYTFKYQEIPAK